MLDMCPEWIGRPGESDRMFVLASAHWVFGTLFSFRKFFPLFRGAGDCNGPV